jgi:hypothetical protein
MDCNIIFGVFFTMHSKVKILVICNNYESNVGMNCSVEFIKT